MAITFGRLERRITVPTGGWTATVTTIPTGSNTATVAAGTSYMSTAVSGSPFVTTVKDALEASTAGVLFTVSIADGEGGTGLVTISADTSFTITWISTDWRDLLGFAGNLTPTATSFTGTLQAKSVWLPDVPLVSPYGPADDGSDESDARWTESPAGHVKALYGSTKRVLELHWPAVGRDRTRIAGETTTNTSFERFYQESIQARAAWADSPAGPIRLYWDAADDTSYVTFKVVGDALKKFRPVMLTDGFIGRWAITLDRCIKVP